MEFTNPNQFEKMRRLEGLKNPEDIWDLATYEKIKKEIENTLINVKELLKEEELCNEAKRCLNKIREFCVEVSEEYRQTFLSLLQESCNGGRRISKKIIDYLCEKKFILPNFTIASREPAQKLLKRWGFYEDINEENLLLVFQLPKPLAQFWWKGGANSWGDKAIDIKNQAIEWGYFYRELMPVIWEIQGRYENENGLDFQRINDIGEHDPKNYYYIWEVSEWENED